MSWQSRGSDHRCTLFCLSDRIAQRIGSSPSPAPPTGADPPASQIRLEGLSLSQGRLDLSASFPPRLCSPLRSLALTEHRRLLRNLCTGPSPARAVLLRTEAVVALLQASRRARSSILLHRGHPLLPISLRSTAKVALAAANPHRCVSLNRLQQDLSGCDAFARTCPSDKLHSDTTRHNGSVQSPAGYGLGFGPHSPGSQPWRVTYHGGAHNICRPSCTFAHGSLCLFVMGLGISRFWIREMEADETFRTQRYGFTLCCRRLHGASSSPLAWS